MPGGEAPAFRPFPMIPITFRYTGPLRAGLDLDNALYPGGFFSLDRITVFCRKTGTSGTIRLNVRRNDVSLFDAAVKQPQILGNTGDNRIDITPACDIADTEVSSYDVLSVVIEDAPTDAEDVSVILWMTPTYAEALPFVFRTFQGLQAGALIDVPLCPGLVATIDRVTWHLGTPGSTGDPLVCTLLKNNDALFADDAQRPSFALNTTDTTLVTPGADLLSAAMLPNDTFAVRCESAPDDAASLSVILWGLPTS